MNTSNILKECNIKPSLIRIMVFDYLKSTMSHPTADEIFNELSPKIPTLSKTSVYNTLKLLTQNNLALALTIDSEQARYDADTSVHGHFMCDECKRVFDFQLDKIGFDELYGFDIKEKNVYFSGICKNCLNK